MPPAAAPGLGGAVGGSAYLFKFKVAERTTSGRLECDEFYMKETKLIIDVIDRVLAEHYGFTDEELDFVINYDIKYRMGLSAGGQP